MRLNATEVAALSAVARGRVPANETVRARLKRKGLISRAVLGTGYCLTELGRKTLLGLDLSARRNR